MSEITVAASEDAVKELFVAMRDGFRFDKRDRVDFGPFSAGYDVALRLEDGEVDLRSDNSIAIEELDVKWDTLKAWLGFDIREICFGGWCILPTPFGCAVRVPRVCVFSRDPDIKPELDLSGIATSEVSVTASPETRYFVDPSRPPGMTPIQAEMAGMSNRWQVFLDPGDVDLDPIDIADTVGDLLERAVSESIDALLPGPDWFRDAILAILGPIIDLIRRLLSIPDEIGDWLSDLLNARLGLFNLIFGAILDYFAEQSAIVDFEDPFPILPAAGGLIPVKVPITDFAVRVSDVEMVVEADVGS